jgi:geranylgeranyl reductase family protein
LKKGYDVIVVGAGPAGVTLAYELGKKGVVVLVLEKEKLPRYKCCAGGLTSKAAKLLDFDISQAVEAVIHELSFTFNLSSPYPGRHSQPLIYTVMRDVFDQLLVERAQQAGVVFMDGQKVTKLEMNSDLVDISTAEDTFRCRVVAGADGAYSVVARELGMGKHIKYLAGIESEVVVSKVELAKWQSRVQADLGYIPGGYAWVFPKRDHLSIGAGCLASKAKSLDRRHQEFLDSLGIGSYAIARTSSHLIPTCTKGRLVWQDRALLLGDAAGFADPLTGEGIYNAILSAQLAAPVIEQSVAGGQVKLQDYQGIIERKIVSELEIARKLSRFFVHFPRLAFGMLNQSENVWKAMCGLIRGELQYSDIVRGSTGGLKSIFSRMLRA